MIVESHITTKTARCVDCQQSHDVNALTNGYCSWCWETVELLAQVLRGHSVEQDCGHEGKPCDQCAREYADDQIAESRDER